MFFYKLKIVWWITHKIISSLRFGEDGIRWKKVLIVKVSSTLSEILLWDNRVNERVREGVRETGRK